MEHYQFISKLFDFSQLKVQQSAFWGGVFGYWISIIAFFTNEFLGISIGLFFLLFLIMITDYITGLEAAKHEERVSASEENRPVRNIFKSKKGLGWVFKLGSYLVFLAMSVFVRKEIIVNPGFEFMLWPFLLIHYYLLVHILKWETKSIDENFERLGYSFNILKLVISILNMAKSKIKTKIEQDGQ